MGLNIVGTDKNASCGQFEYAMFCKHKTQIVRKLNYSMYTYQEYGALK